MMVYQKHKNGVLQVNFDSLLPILDTKCGRLPKKLKTELTNNVLFCFQNAKTAFFVFKNLFANDLTQEAAAGGVSIKIAVL